MGKIEDIANSIGGYIMKHFVSPWGRDVVRYYRAKVITPANGSVIVVKRPFDNTTMALPYTTAAESLEEGQQCIVLVLGDASNAVVFSDGRMKNIGSGGGGGGTNVSVSGTTLVFQDTD